MNFFGISDHERKFIMKKEKIEIKDIKDIALLEKKEQEKWEIALELGLFDQVVQKGWKSLTARQSGKVGGIMAARRKIKEDKAKSKEDL